jgi:hypothetical protein
MIEIAVMIRDSRRQFEEPLILETLVPPGDTHGNWISRSPYIGNKASGIYIVTLASSCASPSGGGYNVREYKVNKTHSGTFNGPGWLVWKECLTTATFSDSIRPVELLGDARRGKISYLAAPFLRLHNFNEVNRAGSRTGELLRSNIPGVRPEVEWRTVKVLSPDAPIRLP